MKQLSDYEKVALIVERIERGNFSIADNYDDFLHVGFAFASDLGEQGRELFHRVCRLSSKYTSYETENRKYDNCLSTGRGEVHLGTFFKLAEDAGVDITLPDTMFTDDADKPRRGRPKKTEEEKEEERKNLFARVKEAIDERYEFRYNMLSERTEMKPREEEWRDLDDREFNGILTELHSINVHVSKENLATYIHSDAFSAAYNPVEAYIQSLKPWNRRTDHIRQIFNHLHLEEGADTEFLFQVFKLWFVCFVACAAGLEVVNQLMLVLAGEKEGTGKTELLRRILPKPLRQYLHAPTQLSNFRDKDEALATAHCILFFLDEIMLNRQTYNKLKNMVGGAGAQVVTERSPYAREAKVRRVYASLAATTNHIDFIPEDFGSRRLVVLNVVGSDNYDDLPIDKAFAQAYYLATHPRRFSTKITPEMIAKLKETNKKYVAEDLCSALIPTILRKPNPAEQSQAVTTGEIIAWLTSRTGPNREFTAPKVGISMRKLGFEPKKTKQGMRYLVVRVMMDELERENKRLANQALEPEMPF